MGEILCDFAIVVSTVVIERTFGRTAFGEDPGAYHRARPDYPEWVFETLRDRCGLGPGAVAFEVGAGTGKATERLLELGARPLIAVEPDSRSADFLRDRNGGDALTVMCSAFEDVVLEEAGFDLGVSATAFHWLDEDLALAKVAKLLKPGGWWAMVWNVFGDDSRPAPFHEATPFLHGPASPSEGTGGTPFGLDVAARVAALDRTGAFEAVEHWASPWSLVLDAERTVALYATYSNVNVREDRDAILAELGRVARDEFQNRVTRNMTTCLYIARRLA